MEKLRITAFRATDEPEKCELFLQGHRKVLEDFGIENVTTNNDDWCNDPDTYVVIAESPEHGVVGGIRIEVSRGERQLPIAEALRKMDGRIDKEIADLASEGTAEVCGLWNANSFNMKGLPVILSFAAVSLANQLNIRSMVCLVAHYTLRHALRVGFTIMEYIGIGGTFTYPIPSIQAIAMVIPDVIAMDSATLENRRNLLSLRLRPEQTRIESPANTPLEVTYKLILLRKVITLVPYQDIQNERLRYIA